MAGDTHTGARAACRSRSVAAASARPDEEVERLKSRIAVLEREKLEMVDNFRVTTSVLLERIKTLESQDLQSRPSTSLVMDRVVASGLPGGRAKTHKPEVLSVEEANRDICGNCGKSVPPANLASHTVHCYRHFTRCRPCDELVPLAQEEEHNKIWTDTAKWATAVAQSDFGSMGRMVGHGMSVDIRVDEDNHILHVGAKSDNVEFITFAVSRGAEVDPVNAAGERPIHIAANCGAALYVRYLVELGADFDALNSHGETALHLAARKGHAKVARYLVDEGANTDAVNRLGDTAMQVAQRHGHLDTCLAMGQSGAPVRLGGTLRDGCLGQVEFDDRQQQTIVA